MESTAVPAASHEEHVEVPAPAATPVVEKHEVVKEPTPVATPVPVAVPVSPAAAAGPSTSETSSLLRQNSVSPIDMFKQMEIRRINGYLHLVNLIMGLALLWLGLYNFYHLNSYMGFISAIFIIFQAVLIVLFELRDNFPNASKLVQNYLGFMYTAHGRGIFFLVIGTWCPTQGAYGIVMGVSYCLLAVVNFFIIYQHPGYKEAMSVPDDDPEAHGASQPAAFYGSTEPAAAATTPEKAV
ncbi:hypothetical protein AC1031_009186 [Aphanomyces cochlioides]|nr:hypothetical protein AC1031_009186 [Aphanomyces cochlioides]